MHSDSKFHVHHLQNKTLLIHPKFRLFHLSLLSLTLRLLSVSSVVAISNPDIHCQQLATFMLFMKLLLNKASLKCKVRY